jgi:hypothetical protein
MSEDQIPVQFPEAALPEPEPQAATPQQCPLAPDEVAALALLANNVTFLRDLQSKQRASLVDQLAELDQKEAHAEGMFQGAMRYILQVRKMTHDDGNAWHFDPANSCLTTGAI